MSTRTERDKSKSQQERHQMILSQLLKDEDNKYCVDCDAKGPRWASWNLGIFLCIRCAGIHRNLGVHISKVKSVNLDTWTSEQIAMVQEMGNSRARAVYEANLPDNFRRPQTDSGLEAFIRAKYELKKYIAQEWIPPQPKLHAQVDDSSKKEKKKARPKQNPAVQLNNVPAPNKSTTTHKTESKPTAPVIASKASPPAASVDLLGLDTPAVPSSNHAPSTDPFGDFISVAPSANGEVAQAKPGESSSSNDLQDMGLFSDPAAAPADKQKQTKENIMALFGSNTAGGGSQMFNVPGGVYMQQQPAAQQQMWAGTAQNGMMPTSQANMAMPANMGMMGVQQGGNMMAGGVPQMPNMMGQMGVGQQAAMMQQTAMMQNMYNTNSGMYNMPQQLQQVQNQMGSMSLGGAGMQQPGMVAAGGGSGGGGSWTGQNSGQTLHNNLWQ